MRKMKDGDNSKKHVTIPIIFVVDLLFSVIVRLLSQLKFPRWHDYLSVARLSSLRNFVACIIIVVQMYA